MFLFFVHTYVVGGGRGGSIPWFNQFRNSNNVWIRFISLNFIKSCYEHKNKFHEAVVHTLVCARIQMQFVTHDVIHVLFPGYENIQITVSWVMSVPMKYSILHIREMLSNSHFIAL